LHMKLQSTGEKARWSRSSSGHRTENFQLHVDGLIRQARLNLLDGFVLTNDQRAELFMGLRFRACLHRSKTTFMCSTAI
jgi:hypothetical protein